jgi:predicted transcriptional regulator YheO
MAAGTAGKGTIMGQAKAAANRSIFKNFEKLAVSMGATFGPNCEVAIHDFARLPQSLIYIHGAVTGRKPGAPITDLVVRMLRRDGDAVQDMHNYRSVTRQGRVVKSSTTFIRDTDGTVIGAFCINFDITDHLNAAALLNDFTRTATPTEPLPKETFAASLDETIASLVDPVVAKTGKQPVTMPKKDRIELIRALEGQGVFLVRGSVDFMASRMGVTKFTIYNYLKEVRSQPKDP